MYIVPLHELDFRSGVEFKNTEGQTIWTTERRTISDGYRHICVFKFTNFLFTK